MTTATDQTAARADVDRVANAMLRAFEKTENKKVAPTYVAAVVDMARAAIAEIQPETRAWVALDAVRALIPTEGPGRIDAGHSIEAADLLDALATPANAPQATETYTTVQMSGSAPGGDHVIHLGSDLRMGTGDNVCGLSRHGFSTDGHRYGFSVGGGYGDRDATPCLGCVAALARKRHLDAPVSGMFAHLFAGLADLAATLDAS